MQIRTKVNLHKKSNCWTSNKYRTVSCRNYWNLACQIRNACNQCRGKAAPYPPVGGATIL